MKIAIKKTAPKRAPPPTASFTVGAAPLPVWRWLVDVTSELTGHETHCSNRATLVLADGKRCCVDLAPHCDALRLVRKPHHSAGPHTLKVLTVPEPTSTAPEVDLGFLSPLTSAWLAPLIDADVVRVPSVRTLPDSRFTLVLRLQLNFDRLVNVASPTTAAASTTHASASTDDDVSEQRALALRSLAALLNNATAQDQPSEERQLHSVIARGDAFTDALMKLNALSTCVKGGESVSMED